MMTGDCIICGKQIPIYNITNSCRDCFNKYKKKDKFGNWEVRKAKQCHLDD